MNPFYKTHLLHPCAEVVERIGMDVSTREQRQEVLLGQGQRLSLDEVDALVLQRGRPVRVAE